MERGHLLTTLAALGRSHCWSFAEISGTQQVLFPCATCLPTASGSGHVRPQQRKGSCHSLLQFITNSPLLKKVIYPTFGLIWLRKLTLLRPVLGPRLIHSLPLEKDDDN